MDTTAMKAISKYPGTPNFEELPHLMFKLAGTEESVKDDRERLEKIFKKEGGKGMKIAKTVEEGEELWSARKSVLLALLSDYEDVGFLSTDVAVPLSNLAPLIEYHRLDAEQNNVHTAILGHAGDGNFHSLIVYEKNEEAFKKALQLEHRLINRALELDGTCSGEHGIGLEKKEFLKEEYDENALDLMRMIKKMVDPKNILNPGHLIPE